MVIEGRAAEVAAWRLLGLGTRAPLEQRPPRSAFVGREGELAQITAALARSERERAACLLAVVGPAGIGKSRLASEAIAGLGDAATVVTGRCLSYGEGIAYRPLAEIVRQLAEGGELRDALAGDEGAEQVERGILGAIGRSDEPAQPEETFWAVRRLFEAVARERPLVVVIEDVHWAEPTLLDLIDYLVAFSSGAPILLVCLRARSCWSAGRRGRRRSRSASVVALDGARGRGRTDARRRRWATPSARGAAHRRAGGGQPAVPRAARGRRRRGARRCRRRIEAVLAARIDQLEPGERARARARLRRGPQLPPRRGRRAARTDALGAPLDRAGAQPAHPPRPRPSTPARTPSASPTR